MARPSCKLATDANPHDFIEVSLFVIDDIFAQTVPLYEKGLSLREIPDRTGFPKSSIRKELTKTRSGTSADPPRHQSADVKGPWQNQAKALNHV
jgi:hypothetical protein